MTSSDWYGNGTINIKEYISELLRFLTKKYDGDEKSYIIKNISNYKTDNTNIISKQYNRQQMCLSNSFFTIQIKDIPLNRNIGK